MGYNISGISVAKNLQDDLKSLENEIGFDLELIEEVSFEEGSSNWKEEDICDIYFSKKGTLIFLSHELSIEAYSISNLPTLTFAISEGAMTFCFQYCEKGELVRSKGEAEGKRLREEGKSLDIEYASSDTLWQIWTLIERILGKSYPEIDLDEKVYRYKLQKKPMEKEDAVNSIMTKTESWKGKFMWVMFFYKTTRWIIGIGLVLTLLSIFRIYDNYGFILILFGSVGRIIAIKKMRLKKLINTLKK